MAKVLFWCDNGANIHSCLEQEFNIEELGFTAEEWNSLSDNEKCKIAEEWATSQLDFGYREVND